VKLYFAPRTRADLTLLEPSAIALHLADRFPVKQLAPPPGSAARGAYYQWLLFTESTLAPVVMKIYEQAQQAQEVPVADRARLSAILDVVGTAVERSDFLAGGHFTAADLSMASLLHLANQLRALEERPRLVEYLYVHCKRPACSRAVS
jgi:glutathione S-transferase